MAAVLRAAETALSENVDLRTDEVSAVEPSITRDWASLQLGNGDWPTLQLNNIGSEARVYAEKGKNRSDVDEFTIARQTYVIQTLYDREKDNPKGISGPLQKLVNNDPSKFYPRLWKSDARRAFNKYFNDSNTSGTAIVLMGQPRTFGARVVRERMRKMLIDPLKTLGPVHIFAYFNKDNKYTQRVGSKWIGAENSERDFHQWVSELGANYTMAYYDGEVYAKECTQHPLKPMTGPCQQLVHLKEAWKIIQSWEHKNDHRFRHVIRFRPDALPSPNFNAKEMLSNHHACVHLDFTFVLPRWLVTPYLRITSLFADGDKQSQLLGIGSCVGDDDRFALLFREDGKMQTALGERCILKAHQYSEGIVQLNKELDRSECGTWLVRPESWPVFMEMGEQTEDTLGDRCGRNAKIGEFPMYNLYSLCK
eukprot:CAMPEP_0114502414 /NCGR_PEP_ID=MMETSP0109-20121206/9079_1 /TAXON_ID=29199 /ORGANISM="Chlorarachnion reptans, Strain CCCM449" /LENGTH=422 /DNA_ID=CAMNT_0001680329 /DNA_START=164 /DNA_END=1432 /DNA_ORIENTATION=+